MSAQMILCIKPSKGYIVGKSYKCVSKYGKYVEVIDETGEKQIMLSTYFKNFLK